MLLGEQVKPEMYPFGPVRKKGLEILAGLKLVVDRLIETTMEKFSCEVTPGALTAVP